MDYKGLEDDVLVPRIIAALVNAGYIVERVSVRHNTGGYGSTRGIGDLLVWRETWGEATGVPGLKVNLEVKTSRKAKVSREQRISLGIDGLVLVCSPDEAVEAVQKAEGRLVLMMKSDWDFDRLTNTVGSEGVMYREVLTRGTRRRQKWFTEAIKSAET